MLPLHMQQKKEAQTLSTLEKARIEMRSYIVSVQLK